MSLIALAGTIKAADESLLGRPVDAVILDLGLPDSNKEQTLSWLSRQKMPVIVITADDAEAVVSEVFRYGAQDYLVKGAFVVKDLCRVVIYSIERYRLMSQLLLHHEQLERMVKDRVSEIAPSGRAVRPLEDSFFTHIAQRALFELLPALVFWKDLKGVYLGCNELFASFLGVSSVKDVLGRMDKDFERLRDYGSILRTQDDRVLISRQVLSVPLEEAKAFAAFDPCGRLVKTSLIDRSGGQEKVVGVLGVYSRERL